MKRRNFLKGLAALAATAVVAPAALADTSTPPAKPTGPFKWNKNDDVISAEEQIAAAKKAMRNPASEFKGSHRGKLGELYVSPEAMEDIRMWGVDQIDETTRREIMVLHNNGMVSNGTLLGVNHIESDPFDAHVQHMEISAQLDREEINELGRKSPYYKYVSFPVEVKEEMGLAILDNRNILKAEL